MVAPVNWSKVPMLTPGMKNFGNQFNLAFPARDGTSDGAIGDWAHSQENSDHNPDDTSAHNAGWEDADKIPDIRAIDVGNNLNFSGVSMQMVIDHLRKLSNLKTVFRYMIYNRKMYHVDNSFNPTNYTGKSPHTEHAHFSGAHTEASDQNTTFDFRLDDIAMPTAKEIAHEVWTGNEQDVVPVQGGAGTWWLKDVVGKTYDDVTKFGQELKNENIELKSQVTQLQADVAEIKALLSQPTGGIK